jgi:hypothetical protein
MHVMPEGRKAEVTLHRHTDSYFGRVSTDSAKQIFRIYSPVNNLFSTSFWHDATVIQKN